MFGLKVGALLVGYSAENLVDATPESLARVQSHWAAWLGVSVFALGVYLYSSAPRGSLRWILVVVLAAFATQQVAATLLDKSASGFFGMLVATPLSYLIQHRFRGPPAMVTFLPSFWVLVPGALSLVGVKYMLSDPSAAIDDLVAALFALVSIALGTLIGASLYKWLNESPSWWRLQFARTQRRFRRNTRP